jgi:hypothetical protein
MALREGILMINTLTPVHLGLDPALSATLSVITIVFLFVILVFKELVSTKDGRWLILGRYLNVAIFPLLFCFCVIVAIRVADVLNK